MKVVLLRVGIDTGCYCGIYAPLFEDRTFEYIPIPDYPANIDNRTYGNYIGKNERPLLDYFPESYQSKMKAQSIHFDPEFETLTYGDPTRPKQSLARLELGDILAFYCGLEGFPNEKFRSARALYLFAYFEVLKAGHTFDFEKAETERLFGANFHILHPTDDRDRLILVKGAEGSRLLTRATKISDLGKDKSGKDIFVLSKEMQEHFGTFTELNAIQRSNPRWVSQPFIERAAQFVRSLD